MRDKIAEKEITRKRAARVHQGVGHWHVEKRSTVIICRACRTKIPKWRNPSYCPVCFDGRDEVEPNDS